MRTTLIFFTILLLSPLNALAQEARFFLDPSSGVYTIGDEFDVAIVVDTGAETINAAEGAVTFNTEELEVVGILIDNSLFTSWTLPPEFNNEEGTISFAGLTPAAEPYTGSRGEVLSVTFKALRNIASKVRFSNGAAVLASDGKASNILTEMNSGVYTLNAQEVVPNIEYVVVDNTPENAVISSVTHPDPEGWAATTTAILSWDIPEDVTSLRMLFDDSENSIPTVYYAEPISTKTIADIEDGESYFHLQMQNASGWGEVSHYRIGVDTVNPSRLLVSEVARPDATDPYVTLAFKAIDELSGVERFEILSGDSAPIAWEGTEDQSFRFGEPFDPGSHTIVVKVFDKAGNMLEGTVVVEVESIPAPHILGVPENIDRGGPLVVRGKTIPSADVSVWVSRSGAPEAEHRIKSDGQGIFSLTLEQEATDGVYEVWAQATDARGAVSEESPRHAIIVRPTGVVMLGEKAIGVLSIIVPLIALVVVLIVFLAYGWFRLRHYKKRIRHEVGEAKDVLHESFSGIERSVIANIKILESARRRRKLTFEEKTVLERFKVLLQKDEEFEEEVEKEIQDISEVATHRKTPKRITIQKLD